MTLGNMRRLGVHHLIATCLRDACRRSGKASCACAGRLVAWDKATGSPVEHRLPVAIGLIEDPAEHCSGPIWLRGGIAVVSADGFEYEARNRMTLCRCGASKNKPFCDGAHASVKFDARKKAQPAS